MIFLAFLIGKSSTNTLFQKTSFQKNDIWLLVKKWLGLKLQPGGWGICSYAPRTCPWATSRLDNWSSSPGCAGWPTEPSASQYPPEKRLIQGIRHVFYRNLFKIGNYNHILTSLYSLWGPWTAANSWIVITSIYIYITNKLPEVEVFRLITQHPSCKPQVHC